LQVPAGVTLNSASAFMSESGDPSLLWLEQSGDGVLTSWDGYHGGFIYYIGAGSTGTASISLSFGAELIGDLSFQWQLEDIGIWTPPDMESGTIVVESAHAGIIVAYPDEETTAVIGQDLAIEFQAFNTSGQIDIDLQRVAGGPWERLVSGLSATAETWTWTVDGEPGPYARIRVADAVDPELAALSEVFVVGRDVSWAQLANAHGAIAAGEQVDVTFTLDSTDLALGLYDAALVVSLSSGETVVVPIALTVDPSTAVDEDVPTAVALLGNYPNPFNPSTTISFALPRAMDVRLDVYSLRGLRVKRLLHGEQGAGRHHVVWDGTDHAGKTVASGVYMTRLVTDDGAEMGKLLLAK